MILELLRAVLALGITLGLLCLVVWFLRRFGARRFFFSPLKSRRLELLETLVLDQGHKLALVRCDQQQGLILLGEGAVISQALTTLVLPQAPLSQGSQAQTSLAQTPSHTPSGPSLR